MTKKGNSSSNSAFAGFDEDWSKRTPTQRLRDKTPQGKSQICLRSTHFPASPAASRCPHHAKRWTFELDAGLGDWMTLGPRDRDVVFRGPEGLPDGTAF